MQDSSKIFKNKIGSVLISNLPKNNLYDFEKKIYSKEFVPNYGLSFENENESIFHYQSEEILFSPSPHGVGDWITQLTKNYNLTENECKILIYYFFFGVDYPNNLINNILKNIN